MPSRDVFTIGMGEGEGMKCPDGHEMVRDYCSEKIDYVCLVCGFIHRKEIAANGDLPQDRGD